MALGQCTWPGTYAEHGRLPKFNAMQYNSLQSRAVTIYSNLIDVCACRTPLVHLDLYARPAPR